MDQKKDIAVLLSTYNGEAYLEAFFNSIISQTNQEFILIVRDDGSTDGTIDIIKQFTNDYENFKFMESRENLGSKLSFGHLLEHGIAKNQFNYFMFADQDDVWLADKINKSLEKIKEMEFKYQNVPILIHTDLIVVDNQLNILSNSFWKYQNLNPEFDQLNRLIMQNMITGCTVMLNNKLAQLSCPVPVDAIMHDWWIGLIASTFGKIGYLEEATIYYRQHTSNALGARKFNFSYLKERILKPVSINKNIMQAKKFFEQYEDKLTNSQKKLFRNFIGMSNGSYLSKIIVIVKWKLFKIGFIRNIGLLLKIR